ncbi:LapA family protein [Pseudonocardia bannensis]|uniref:LapA family protein n=1 Tax=Pseudonocardia bannensis TaxID=630973 RepID=A0A848DK47_9PSEU|nr:LapA family protein [Pseudonocardia bannensis]
MNRTRVSGLWVGLILSALVLLLLLIFILQNLGPVQVNFLGATGTLPTGVALLLAAIAGVLLVAIPGTGRIIQLRRAARRGADRGR